MSEYLLQMNNITKTFPGVIANDHVSIAIEKGKVLGLLGENGAGKSTLMNMLYGLLKPDEGEIYLEGKKVDITSPLKAIDLGIGMVHQHFKSVDTLSVIENVILGMPTNKAVLDLENPMKKFLKLCDDYDLHVDPDIELWKLPVGQQQWVEILKALYRDCKVLVLDEPTAVLTPKESDHLADAIKKIVSKGKSVIFISHKLREVIKVTDKITVLRDGTVVGSVNTKDADEEKLSQMMVGRPVSIHRMDRPNVKFPGDALRIEGLNVYDDRGVHALQDLSLTVKKGEILGVAGVDGNGQRELASAIAGLITPSSGKIFIGDKEVKGVVSDTSVLGFVPEDRHKTGLVLDFSVQENLVIKDYMHAPFSNKGVLNYKAIHDNSEKLIEEFKIKTPNSEVAARTLSGGNQQKVVLARELTNSPTLVIAAHPTRGLDLGAVVNVHECLMNERNRGAGVLFISAELQEVMAISDRIIVLYNGMIMGELDGNNADVNKIGLLMLGKRL